MSYIYLGEIQPENITIPNPLEFPNKIKYPNVLNIPKNFQFLKNIPNHIFSNFIDTIYLTYASKTCNFEKHNLEKDFIKINIFDKNFVISDSFKNSLEICNQNSKERFIILPIGIFFPKQIERNIHYKGSDLKDGHFNVAILDTYSKTVEIFEPHGLSYKGGYEFDNITLIKPIVHQLLSSTKSYEFTNASLLCPLGLQQNDSFCIAWGLLFLEMRLMNPSFSSQEIVDTFNKYMTTQRNDYFERYISYIYMKSFSHKTEFNLSNENFLTFPNTIPLSNVFDKSFLINRIAKLIYYLDYNVLDDFQYQIIIQELYSYSFYEHFHVMIKHTLKI